MPFHGVDLIIVISLGVFIMYRVVKFISGYTNRRLQVAESLQNEVAALRAEVHALREEHND